MQRVITAACGSLVLVTGLGAQEGQTERGGVALSVEFDPTIRFDADFDGVAGSIGVASYPLSINIGYSLSDDVSLNWQIAGRIDDYDVDGALLVPGEPDLFDEVYGLSFSGNVRWKIDENWSLLGGGFVNFSWEDEAEMGDSATGGGLVVASYRFGDSLTVGGGVLVSSRLEDDVLVVPAIFVRWDINEKWRFETEGLNGTLSYTVNDDLSVFFRGGYSGNEFLLEDNGGATSEGVVRDSHARLGLGFEYSPESLPGFSLEVLGGVTVAGELEVLDSNGNELFEEDIDPGGFFGVRARYRF